MTAMERGLARRGDGRPAQDTLALRKTPWHLCYFRPTPSSLSYSTGVVQPPPPLSGHGKPSRPGVNVESGSTFRFRFSDLEQCSVVDISTVKEGRSNPRPSGMSTDHARPAWERAVPEEAFDLPVMCDQASLAAAPSEGGG